MNEKYIIKLFPEIKKIKDSELRKGVVNIWVLAMQKGGWSEIDSIPFTLLIPTTRTLVEHTRAVTNMAIAIADQRSDLNVDHIICGALAHDAGKLLEYKKSGDHFIKSEYGKLIRHPVSGYGLALDAGLPVEIAHIIAAHSSEGEKVTRSNEAVVIHHCDFIDFDIARSQ
jgi:putative nucleotidyltransferase with HDIG domain